MHGQPVVLGLPKYALWLSAYALGLPVYERWLSAGWAAPRVQRWCAPAYLRGLKKDLPGLFVQVHFFLILQHCNPPFHSSARHADLQ